MARSITTIFNEMIAAKEADPALASLTSTSAVAFWRLIFYIVASSHFVVESLYDVLKSDVDTDLSARLTHGDGWYVKLAKAFQFGDGINPLTGKYDVIDESKMVVNYAAADDVNGQVILKIATDNNGVLEPLPDGTDVEKPNMKAAFDIYIEKQKDFGVTLVVRNVVGDELRAVYDIYFDPMVMDQTGMLLRTGGYPVKDTIKAFTKSLPFNGEFQPVLLTDALQKTTGVVIPVLKSCETRYAGNDWAIVEAAVKPYSGYLTIADELLEAPYINFLPHDAN